MLRDYLWELYYEKEKADVEIEDADTVFPILRSDLELAVKKWNGGKQREMTEVLLTDLTNKTFSTRIIYQIM